MRKQNFFQKGFTLIELLVVIAIIGILAAVVLASLSSARDKGKIAKIQSQLASARSQAEIYRSTFGTFKRNLSSNQSVCAPAADDDGGINAMIQASGDIFDNGQTVLPYNGGSTQPGAAQTSSANSTHKSICWVSNDGQKWVASVPLNTGTVKAWWCVDSAGNSKQRTTPLSNTSPAYEC